MYTICLCAARRVCTIGALVRPPVHVRMRSTFKFPRLTRRLMSGTPGPHGAPVARAAAKRISVRACACTRRPLINLQLKIRVHVADAAVRRTWRARGRGACGGCRNNRRDHESARDGQPRRRRAAARRMYARRSTGGAVHAHVDRSRRSWSARRVHAALRLRSCGATCTAVPVGRTGCHQWDRPGASDPDSARLPASLSLGTE